MVGKEGNARRRKRGRVSEIKNRREKGKHFVINGREERGKKVRRRKNG